MQVRPRIKTAPPETQFDKVLEQELLSYAKEIANILNSNLKYQDNFNCQIITIADTGASDTEYTVAHSLKRVPIGYHVIKIDKSAVAYDSGTAWTVTDIYLKFSAANCAVKIIVF